MALTPDFPVTFNSAKMKNDLSSKGVVGLSESAVAEMYRLGPIVQEYDELLFSKIVSDALETGLREINITGWTFEAVRTLLAIIRYRPNPPVLKSGERVHIFVRPPATELMDPFSLYLAGEPW